MIVGSDDEYGSGGSFVSSSSSKSRRRVRKCRCCSLFGSDATHRHHKMEEQTGSVARWIGSCFVFAMASLLSCITSRMFFVQILVSGLVMFGPVVSLYELSRGSTFAPELVWVSAVIAWVAFLVNFVVFLRSSIPKIRSDLNTRGVFLLFLDAYAGVAMTNAGLAFSIWALDTSTGKTAQFFELGDETANGYMIFARLWVATMSITVQGTGLVLPVGVFALVWRTFLLLNTVIFLILINVWAQSMFSAFYATGTINNSASSTPRSTKKKNRKGKREIVPRFRASEEIAIGNDVLGSLSFHRPAASKK